MDVKILKSTLAFFYILSLVGCGTKCDIATFDLELTSIELIHSDTGEELDSGVLSDDRQFIEATFNEGNLEKNYLGFLLSFESGVVYVYK